MATDFDCSGDSTSIFLIQECWFESKIHPILCSWARLSYRFRQDLLLVCWDQGGSSDSRLNAKLYPFISTSAYTQEHVDRHTVSECDWVKNVRRYMEATIAYSIFYLLLIWPIFHSFSPFQCLPSLLLCLFASINCMSDFLERDC